MPSGSAWLWISRWVSVDAETSYRCRGVKFRRLRGWGTPPMYATIGGKATIGLVVVTRGTGELMIFRNCRVSGSERIERCPSASEQRTGSHKSAVYWGHHGLHGEWLRLCHKIRQVVWHSSQCVTRWWVENSVPPQRNMYAYWSSPKMGEDCHWCDDIKLCSWSTTETWLVMGRNAIHRACGLVNCRLTVFLYSFSPCRQISWKPCANSHVETFHKQM